MELHKKMGQTVVMSWANQNKQPAVYLDSGVYLTPKISPYLIPSLSLPPWHFSPGSSLVSKIFPHFQGIFSSQNHQLFPSGSPSSFQDPFFFTGTLLFSVTSSFWNHMSPVFPV